MGANDDDRDRRKRLARICQVPAYAVTTRSLPALTSFPLPTGRSAGGIDMLTNWLTPVMKLVHYPPELLPMAMIRPLSGSGTLGVFTDIVTKYGPDHFLSRVAGTIDEMFRNSPQPTKAESEKAFGLEFVAMMGNVKAFILSICGAVVFATLLVSANTMAMSICERTREVAVLKTLGFSGQTVCALVVVESLLLCLFTAVIGLLLSCAAIKTLGSALGAGVLPLPVIAGGLAIAVILALISGLPPAIVC